MNRRGILKAAIAGAAAILAGKAASEPNDGVALNSCSHPIPVAPDEGVIDGIDGFYGFDTSQFYARYYFTRYWWDKDGFHMERIPARDIYLERT